MQPKNLPCTGNSEEHGEDRATGAMLASGGTDVTDGVSAFALRHWRPGGNPAEPVFITWLPGIGRLCLTVKYGRYSLKGADWYRDTGPGLRAMPYPLDQARMGAMRISQVLQLRLKRGVALSSSLALPDMERDRRIGASPA